MGRRVSPLSSRLAGFAWLSFGLHAATFVWLGRVTRAPSLAFEPTAETVAGESLEVEAPATAIGDSDGTSESEPPAPDERANGAVAAAPRSPRAAAPLPSAAASRATLFGAVGVRFATDLATTFTRAFPQAASADAAWFATAFGPAGAAEVTLVLDEDGRLASHAIGGTPSAALRRGVERTVALIAPRTFTAHDPVTKIRVSARVTRDDVHDGLHGDVFALSGGSFSGDVGAAFFALPPGPGPGRRIDVELRLLRP